MEQIYNNGVLYVLQVMSQSQQTFVHSPKRKENVSFQKLMEQKQQPLKEESVPADTSKAEPEEKQERKVQEENEQSVLLTQEMARVQTIVMDASAVTVHDILTVEAAPVVPNDAVQLTATCVEGEVSVLEQAVASQETQVIPMKAETKLHTEIQQSIPEQAQIEAQTPVVTEQAQTADGNSSEPQMERPKYSFSIADEGDFDAEVENAAFGHSQVLFRDVESVPIKVGEAAPAQQESQTPEVDKQLADQMVRAMEMGESKVEIHLKPNSLGAVTVEITRQENGALCVVLHAENLQTRGLLEKHAPNLQALLSVANQETVQVEVPTQQESQQQRFYDGRNGNSQDSRQQQEQHRQNRSKRGEDFLQQLRLGLIPMESEVS